MVSEKCTIAMNEGREQYKLLFTRFTVHVRVAE